MKFYFITLLLLTSYACQNTEYKLSKIEGRQIAIDSNMTSSKSVEKFISPFKTKIDHTMSQVLAYNPEYMNKEDGELNTAIGNMMADIVFELTNPIYKKRHGKNIDLVLLNYGGIRSSINKGNITTRTAYEVMPFENEVVVVTLSPKKMQALLHYLTEAGTAHPIAGMQLLLNTDNTISQVSIQSKPLNPERHYNVATSDFLQNGGDRMNFFKDPIEKIAIDYKIRNVLIDYFKKVDTLRFKRDDRFMRKD